MPGALGLSRTALSMADVDALELRLLGGQSAVATVQPGCLGPELLRRDMQAVRPPHVVPPKNSWTASAAESSKAL